MKEALSDMIWYFCLEISLKEAMWIERAWPVILYKGGSQCEATAMNSF